jgi:hypothetical protein
MRYDEILAAPRLSVISVEPDGELDRIAGAIAARARIDGPDALAALLEGLCAAGGPGAIAAPRTLDLIGHATAAGQLRLGSWVLDATRPEVTDWFRLLATREVCRRLGVRAVRLLGCHTASTEPGRAAIRVLAGILGVEVLGARELLHAGHYDRDGFREVWEFLLVPASGRSYEPCAARSGSNRPGAWSGPHALALGTPPAPASVPGVGPGPHTLELDALPAPALGPRGAGTPRVVSAAGAREILALVQRDAGAPIPGHAGAPVAELALPASRPGGYHVAQVLLGGAFLRVFPGGAAAPGIAYPVRDPGALLALLDGPA